MNGDKVALVIGGARGIGRAVALRLAQDGYSIAVNYVGAQAAADETVGLIAQTGRRAVALRADVTDLDASRTLFEAAVREFGRLDVMVYSAGVNILSGFQELDEAAYDKLFAITKGAYFAMQNAMRHLAEGGRIINLSSGLTRGWAPNAAAYAGSKAAVEQFTRSLSKEAGARGITVNAVLPGVVQTDMTAGYPPARLEAARQQTSFGRLGQPGDIADIVAFLASERSRWITGQLIVANGGSTP